MAQRILIADDSEEIIEILQILLTGEGYEVVTAGDGEEAVSYTHLSCRRTLGWSSRWGAYA